MTHELINRLSSIESFRGRIRFCNEHFKRIASGSSRCVYQLDSDTALKLATNEKGVAQNTTESDFGLATMYEGILNPPMDSCEDGLWLITPRLDRVRMREVAEGFNLSLKELKTWLKVIGDQKNPDMLNSHDLKNADWDKLESLPKLSVLNAVVMDTDLVTGDWARPSSWGKDPQTGEVRVIDWGLTEQTLRDYYSRPKGIEMHY